MSLPHGLLGLLEFTSHTGYDLARMFQESINKFWHAQASQIYRELNRMEENGLVTSETVIQHGRPNKRVYTITDKGRAEFNEWMNTPAPLFKNTHEPIYMYMFFGANAPEATLERLKTCRDSIMFNLESQREINQETIYRYKTLIPDGEKRSIYWQMTQDLGIAKAEAVLQWAEDCIKKLEAIKKC